MIPWKMFWLLTPQSPRFPGFPRHSDRTFTDCPNHFPDINLESLEFFTKNISVWIYENMASVSV